jgi:hypothetical protein
LICDVLDEAVHERVDSDLGASKTTRLKCKGHGDSTCRYLVEWRIGPRNAKTKNGSRLMKR